MSERKYKTLGHGYHWAWAAAGDSNPYVRWVKQVLRYLPEQGDGATLLDVGCGDGYPASLLVARGYDVSGVDVLDGPLAVARERVPGATFYHAERDALPQISDYVLALESLEHMADPSLLLAAALNCERYALISSPPAGHDRYALRSYTEDEVRALFEGCAVEVLVNDGEHRLFQVTPLRSEPGNTEALIAQAEADEAPKAAPKRKKRANRRTE